MKVSPDKHHQLSHRARLISHIRRRQTNDGKREGTFKNCKIPTDTPKPMPTLSHMQMLRHIRKLSINVNHMAEKTLSDCRMILPPPWLTKIHGTKAIANKVTPRVAAMTVDKIPKAEMLSSLASSQRILRKRYVHLTYLLSLLR